jgi:mono/diheme cytochrome c family protein
MKVLPVALFGLAALSACSTAYNPLDDYEQLNPATQLDAPPARTDANFTAEDVARGRYLVGLLGCGSCHTNGALIGEPNMSQLLAGSDTGIAWTNPLAERNPGVVYPANLTPDVDTGIGSWSVAEIVAMIQTGVDKHSGQTLPVMPWPSYANIEPADATAIAAYLLSLPPVNHRVPLNARPGQRAPSPFVHFGVYRSRQ